MPNLRELSDIELNEVSGGFIGSSYNCGGSIVLSFGCNTASYASFFSTQLGAYSGYLAGVYNVFADLAQSASHSVIATDLKNISSYVQLGAQIGAQSATNGLAIYKSVVNAISTSLSNGGTKITFPPSVD
ncbi:hypothetical protein [Gluconobacter japonicus]|uniref:hypothetical protein n=1 Tax=Gluconobacter japonicus TaxID=376620 RepID=UPI001B8CAD1B|nr:hypothetical protein [Gluconobacter japonicus]MBS1050421.1 hypothetical protein [Gluconobacter japonicus]